MHTKIPSIGNRIPLVLSMVAGAFSKPAVYLLARISSLNATEPELAKRLGRGAHAALADILIQFIRRRRHTVPEEHQGTHFPVQVLGAGELCTELLNVGNQLGFCK